MGKGSPKRRKFEIRKAQKRSQKLAKLRLLYTKANSPKEKEKILEKVFKISPWLTKEEFLKPIKNSLD
jgi:hypothetical protein